MLRLETQHNFVYLTSPGTVGGVTTRNVSGFVRDYGRDGWLGPVHVQLLLSIFLSDERGERQRPVICCAATADNSKSPAQSHPPSLRDGSGRYSLQWKGDCSELDSTHPQHIDTRPTLLLILPCGDMHISLLPILLSE